MTIKLWCKKCTWEWNYTGKKKPQEKYNEYVSCPRCRSLVKIAAQKEENKTEVENGNTN